MAKTVNSTVQLRENNIRLIREALRGVDSSTTAGLAAATGISVATCGKILTDLVIRGEALELDLAAPEGGRPPRLYSYNPEYAMTALLCPRTEGGATCIVHAVRDARGRTVEKRAATVEKVDLEAVVGLLDDLTGRYPTLKAVALSIPGLVRDGVVEFCDLPELVGVNIEAAIRERYDFGLVMENDMNLAALGYYDEMLRSGSLVYMVIPRGLCTGAGIVVDGKLIRGQTCFAGELSFAPFGIDRDMQFAGLEADRAVDYTAKLAVTAIAMIDPSVLVIASESMEDGAIVKIRDFCLRCIPAGHMPELRTRESMYDDCLAGLALEAASLASP